MNTSQSKLISIVVPLYNEQDNVLKLVAEITSVARHNNYDYELILVNDGSKDETSAKLLEARNLYDPTGENIRIIEFRRNFGQTAAIAAGFKYARGFVVIPMDGDLQNDPADIPLLLKKMDEGYDVVSGWRINRKDKALSRKLPSKIANYLIGKITGVYLHDYGCTLKAYHSDVVKHLKLYGEMHRFIPALAKWSGANVTEIPVNHRPRIHGVAKYGLGRTWKVMLDLVTIKFLGTFSTRPIHIFGGMGLISLSGSILSALYMIYLKIFEEMSMSRSPLPVLAAMLMMMAVQFMLMGLLAEMQCRTYHESQAKPTYIIRTIIEGKNIPAQETIKDDDGQ